MLAGFLFIFPGFLTLTALAWVYVHFGMRSEVLAVLWGFRPVGLALLLAALVRISRAALKGVFAVFLATAAFAAFYFGHVPFLVVLIGCGIVYIARSARGPGTRTSVAGVVVALAPLTDPGSAESAHRLLDISWFFLKVGLFSFGGAYAVLPYIREGAVATYGWLSDAQMIDALALGETTPGPLISIGIFVGYLAGHGAGRGLLGAVAATFWLFLPSFVFVLAAARHMDALTSRPAVREFLKGVTCGVVGLMFSVSLLLARAAFAPRGSVDWATVALGLTAFAVLTFWKWRLNVVVVVLGGGILGLLRAFVPAPFGGPAV
jgi:chromate transporter